jgi:hypothetical protein
MEFLDRDELKGDYGVEGVRLPAIFKKKVSVFSE